MSHPTAPHIQPEAVAPEPRPVRHPVRVLALYGNIPLYGKERADIQLFTSLQRVGIDALFVTHNEYGHEAIQPALDERGIVWTTAKWPGRFSLKMGARAWLKRVWESAVGSVQLLRAAAAYRPTHLFISTMGHFLGLLPALLVLRTPIVWHMCDTPEPDHAAISKLWRRLIIPRVSRFVCVSHFIEGEFLRLGAPEDKIEVIYDIPMERAPTPPEKALALAPFDGFTVSYIGQLTANKGVDLLVEAALDLCRERSDVRFVLAGDYVWNNPFAQALIYEVEASAYADRIRFLGYVEDIPGLLDATNLLACPSRYEEPLGLVVLEAKQAGVPSVVFPSGGLVELVTKGEDGYVCREKSAEALRDGIAQMLERGKEGLEEMGEAARTSLESLGSRADRFTSAWRDVFERV